MTYADMFPHPAAWRSPEWLALYGYLAPAGRKLQRRVRRARARGTHALEGLLSMRPKTPDDSGRIVGPIPHARKCPAPVALAALRLAGRRP